MKYTLDVNQRGHIINLKAESSDNDTVFFLNISHAMNLGYCMSFI